MLDNYIFNDEKKGRLIFFTIEEVLKHTDTAKFIKNLGNFLKSKIIPKIYKKNPQTRIRESRS